MFLPGFLKKIRTKLESTGLDFIYNNSRGQNTEIEFNELVFHTWKTSSTNSSSMYEKRVRRPRFPCMENESIELVFLSDPQQVAAASALDQIVSSAGWLRLFVVFVVKKSIQGKRVH